MQRMPEKKLISATWPLETVPLKERTTKGCLMFPKYDDSGPVPGVKSLEMQP